MSFDSEGRAHIVCAICFDLGFTSSAFRATLAADADQAQETVAGSQVEDRRENPEPAPPHGDGTDPGGRSGGAVDEPSVIGSEPDRPKDSVAQGRDAPPSADGLEATMLKYLADQRTGADPLTRCEVMQHKDDGRVESLYTFPIDLDTMEPDIKGLLLGDRQPSSRDAFIAAFPTVQLIKNRMVPFKYWLKQPCPARRGDTAPSCVAIRKGVHQYLLENSAGYEESQGLLMGYGYVQEGSDALSFRLGYPDLGVKNAKGESAVPAGGWGVEAFTDDEIPSPWRRPWQPHDGVVLSKRTRNSGDNASEEAFHKATTWFRNCVSNHDQCSEDGLQDLPDRLIDIGEAGGLSGAPVKLVSTAGERGTYACLSHRWGPETPSVKQNDMENFQAGIPWDLLSPTFQDAIIFLRRFSAWHEKELGEPIRYIWIDSLCIIQDSEADWTRQSQKMCDIYSNARITLVESFYEGKEKRLFGKPSPGSLPRAIQVKDARGDSRDLYFRRQLLHHDFMVLGGRVPIWDRAWVLQERLLSRRLLIFGTEELSWQCQAQNECECGLDRLHTEADTRRSEWKGDKAFTPRLIRATSRVRLQRLLGRDPSHAQLRRAWRLVLEGYSGLGMTYRKDTLPAIAGLARSFNKPLGNLRYFAGVFYEDQPGAADGDAPASESPDLAESLLDLLWRLEFMSDARRVLPAPPAVPVSWSPTAPAAAVVYPFVQDELLAAFAQLVLVQGARNVPRLPDEGDDAYELPPVADMYVDAPPTSLAFVGRVWPTRLARYRTQMTIAATEDREYIYHLGAMSDKIWQHRALGRPVDISFMMAQPPALGGEAGEAMDAEALWARLPALAVYPDSLTTEIRGPLFCMALAKFRHEPPKQGLEVKIIFVAMLLEAVGHIANHEGTDLDLSSKDPGELVYRRLGLAYTTQGGWTEGHDDIIKGLDSKPIRVV